jgi:chromosome segregation ATPase
MNSTTDRTLAPDLKASGSDLGLNSNSELQQLRQELEQKDLLVQQLSEELFRLVRDNAGMAANPEVVKYHALEQEQVVSQFSQQLAATQEELSHTQMLLTAQQQENVELRQQNAQMSDRQKQLEQIVEELPNVYRAKFAERMVQIKAKVEMLQRENRQLHAELQSLSYRLANRSRPQRLELPCVQPSAPSLPVFTNA